MTWWRSLERVRRHRRIVKVSMRDICVTTGSLHLHLSNMTGGANVGLLNTITPASLSLTTDLLLGPLVRLIVPEAFSISTLSS